MDILVAPSCARNVPIIFKTILLYVTLESVRLCVLPSLIFCDGFLLNKGFYPVEVLIPFQMLEQAFDYFTPKF